MFSQISNYQFQLLCPQDILYKSELRIYLDEKYNENN